MEATGVGDEIPRFDKPRHVKYWTRCLKTYLPSMYTSNDSNRMYLAYFILSACDILGVLSTLTTAAEREGYKDWIYHCQHPDGGFRMWPGTDFGERASAENAKWDPANGPATYFALASLLILRDDLERVKRRKTLHWIRRLQHSDGSFGETIVDGKIEGGHDPRLGYCATGVRHILQASQSAVTSLNDEAVDETDIDIDALVRSIRRAESFDGGIADAAFHEPQAGYTFCSLGCLTFIDRLQRGSTNPEQSAAPSAPLHPENVTRWLLNLQTTLTDPDDSPPDGLNDPTADQSSPNRTPSPAAASQSADLHQSPDKSSPWSASTTTLTITAVQSPPIHASEPGGFAGRPSKPPDTCYAFWALASLCLLRNSHLAAHSQLRNYLLKLTQHAVTGGFTKFAHDRYADLYHSYLGLAALSLCSTPAERGVDGIAELDPGMCVTADVRTRLEKWIGR